MAVNAQQHAKCWQTCTCAIGFQKRNSKNVVGPIDVFTISSKQICLGRQQSVIAHTWPMLESFVLVITNDTIISIFGIINSTVVLSIIIIITYYYVSTAVIVRSGACTCGVEAVQHAQNDMQGLHQVGSVAAGLECKVEALEQAPCYWQQARLFHVIMQQPAGMGTAHCLPCGDASLVFRKAYAR